MSDGGKGSNRRPTDDAAFGANYDAIFGERKVQRGRFIWDKEKRDFVSFDEYVFPVNNSAPMVMGDIKPYQSMIDGSIIESRSKHREHLKQHGMIEVGNETKYLNQRKPLESPNGLKRTIAEVANCLLKEK